MHSADVWRVLLLRVLRSYEISSWPSQGCRRCPPSPRCRRCSSGRRKMSVDFLVFQSTVVTNRGRNEAETPTKDAQVTKSKHPLVKYWKLPKSARITQNLLADRAPVFFRVAQLPLSRWQAPRLVPSWRSAARPLSPPLIHSGTRSHRPAARQFRQLCRLKCLRGHPARRPVGRI